ncbi:arginine-specific demethylase JMJ22 [Phragmites australis]|uniref:arginine-specific demethylase JMJ22 n=1 Tax=Phragmites australis TaxID=29695 RepID=UPI002D76FBE1|nr:arginine-specific demethylase JMJ22 [Phragmites australis]
MPSAFHSLLLPLKRKRKSKHRRSRIHPKGNEPSKPINHLPVGAAAGDPSFHLKSSTSASAATGGCIVQPLGNLLLSASPRANLRDAGLGALRPLPDDLLLDVLGLLPARDLAALSAASKALCVVASHDPLWRTLVLDELGGGFDFAGSWRATYIAAASGGRGHLPPRVLQIKGFYSDYLFQSWLCANMEMRPEWLARDNIERRRGMSVEQFVAEFEEPNRPVLLEGCLESWPALQKWTREYLLEVSAGKEFAVGPVSMTLDRYFRYADNVQEERPLYLFDAKFAEKVPEMGRDYEVPVYFREDLFSVLGEERPDHRWVIIGPAGSGSSFHVDPNSTSAWNAIIKGAKKWVMFPPEVVPPGVHPSVDGAEVTSPVSIMEWFMNFYGACKTWEKRPIECVCRAGEVVFVPNGWWHLVINLEESIAITQNYVSRRNLLNVLDFLKRPNASELVSGTKDRVNLHDKFRDSINTTYPGMINQLELEAQQKAAARKKKASFWDSAVDANTGGFKFSF